MDWKIIIFILVGLLLLWFISKNYSWPKMTNCYVDIPIKKERRKTLAPEPIFPEDIIRKPWYTKEVDIGWSCDFSPENTVYRPEEISFRVRTVMEGIYDNVKLYSYKEANTGHTGVIYNYQIKRKTSKGFQSGTYSIYVTSYVNNNKLNPDPKAKVNSETSSTGLLKVIIGDCKPHCQGRECGPGGCGVKNGCGSCEEGYECKEGKCVCVPNCEGKSCGDNDGCGGICEGNCQEGYECVEGQCVKNMQCSVEGSPCQGNRDIPGTYYCHNSQCTRCPECSGTQGCPSACIECSKYGKCPDRGLFKMGCSEEGKCIKCPKCGDCPEGCDDCQTNCTGDTDTCTNGKCTCGSGKACKGTTDTCKDGQCYCGTGPACDSSQSCINGECKSLCCSNFYGNLCCSTNGRCSMGIHSYGCSSCGGPCS